MSMRLASPLSRLGGILPGALAVPVILASSAAAQESGAAAGEGMLGAPRAWAMGLQSAGGLLKERIGEFNDLVFYIMAAITVFVAALLVWCVWRYREAANPVPSTRSHHTLLEIAWTVIPVLILIVIAIPSFRLIYYQDRARDAELTITVTGRQWYWHYTYPDAGFAYDSYPVAAENLKPGQLRNLSVDNPLVVPVGATVRVITTGQDVIHSFFVPSLGVQKYTVPGRALETWFRADRVGTYYGQCNQICGTNHWFMPIEVRAVPKEEFARWVAEARTKFARNDDLPAPDGPQPPYRAGIDLAFAGY